VTVVVSLATKPKPEAELAGLVYGLTPVPKLSDLPLYKRPIFWALVVAVFLIIVNIVLW